MNELPGESIEGLWFLGQIPYPGHDGRRDEAYRPHDGTSMRYVHEYGDAWIIEYGGNETAGYRERRRWNVRLLMGIEWGWAR